MVEELISEAVILAAVLAPLTLGLIQVVKATFEVDAKKLPLISVITATVIALAIGLATNQNLVLYALVGVVGGLSSAGLYDQKKITE